ncbi:Calcium-dependent protein kinase 29 [Glycine soja]
MKKMNKYTITGDYPNSSGKSIICKGAKASNKLPHSVVLIRMKWFTTMNQMKKLALKEGPSKFYLSIKMESDYILFVLHVYFEADIDNTRSIEYMDQYKVEKEESLFKADKGYITTDELREAITEHQMGDEAAIDEVFNDVDFDKEIFTHGCLCSTPVEKQKIDAWDLATKVGVTAAFIMFVTFAASAITQCRQTHECSTITWLAGVACRCVCTF